MKKILIHCIKMQKNSKTLQILSKIFKDFHLLMRMQSSTCTPEITEILSIALLTMKLHQMSQGNLSNFVDIR